MNELEVMVEAKAGEISFNLDTLKATLSAELEGYKNLVVTEDSVKDAKKDLATLRKARKELNDKKIEVKKSFMKPYDAFESEVKDALKMIDDAIEPIDSQVKEFEEAKKEGKKSHCKELWEKEVGELAVYLPFERVFKEDWLKVSVDDKDIVSSIQIEVIRVQNDLNAIKALSSEIEDTLLEVYARSDLATAIQKNTDYLNTKALAEKKVAEEVKTEPKVEVPEELPFESDIVDRVCIYISKKDLDKVTGMLEFSNIKFEVKE